MEHPLENGFAFLNPYGLAYLPGSSIKGVLRRAAEELAGELIETDCMGWTQDAITTLFGLESEDRQKEHTRGILTFWDVLPKPARNSMSMEVMTPHYGGYYQGESTPHDSGQPIPIVFLVVPEGAEFSFHLTCDIHRLPEPLSATWQDLVRHAFTHAFDWLGFGAKTAVGYGAMKRDDQREVTMRKEREERARQALQAAEAKRLDEAKKAARATMSPVEQAIQTFLDKRQDKNAPEISAVISAVKQGHMAEYKVAVAEWLKARMQAEKGQWKETSQAKNPDKDREHQNTSLVMKWLRGE